MYLFEHCFKLSVNVTEIFGLPKKKKSWEGVDIIDEWTEMHKSL